MSRGKTNAVSDFLQKAQQFLFEIPAEMLTARTWTHRLRKACVFLWMVTRGFADNRCPMRAAALTYTTLLALVPVLVVALSLSKNFLAESSATVVPQLLDKAVQMIAPQLEYLPADDEAADGDGEVVVSSQARQQAVERIQQFIGNINAGTLGVIGTIALVVVAIRMLMTIEQTFNDIWGIAEGRSIWRKVVYYWTTITLGPLLLIGAVTLTGRLEYLRGSGEERWWLNLAPFVVLWLAFALMYALMPNTRVRPIAALAGGVVGGTLWQLNNLLSTLYISRVVAYSKIYGALGAIPVFLIGLYFSWLIILFGAQVSFAIQNIHIYLQRRIAEKADQHQRELFACRLMLLAAKHFIEGREPPTLEEASLAVNAPTQLLNQLVHRLARGGMLNEISHDVAGLQPARPPESITVADVLYVMRTNDARIGEPPAAKSDEGIENLLTELHAAERAAPANVSFRELANRLNPPGA